MNACSLDREYNLRDLQTFFLNDTNDTQPNADNRDEENYKEVTKLTQGKDEDDDDDEDEEDIGCFTFGRQFKGSSDSHTREPFHNKLINEKTKSIITHSNINKKADWNSQNGQIHECEEKDLGCCESNCEIPEELLNVESVDLDQKCFLSTNAEETGGRQRLYSNPKSVSLKNYPQESFQQISPTRTKKDEIPSKPHDHREVQKSSTSSPQLNQRPGDLTLNIQELKGQSKVSIEDICSQEEMEDLIPEIQCQICFNIALLPKCCNNCHALFCEDCIQNPLTNSVHANCPTCQKTQNNKSANIMLENCTPKKKQIFDLISVFCPNKGCNRKILYNQRDYHLSKCNYRKVKCTNQNSFSNIPCNATCMYKDLDSHFKTSHASI